MACWCTAITRPEKQVRWDENLLADLGVDPERFNNEIHLRHLRQEVLIGQVSLLEALERVLPGSATAARHGLCRLLAEP